MNGKLYNLVQSCNQEESALESLYNGFIQMHVAENANSIILNLVIRYDQKDYKESKRHTFLNIVNLVQILSDDG